MNKNYWDNYLNEDWSLIESKSDIDRVFKVFQNKFGSYLKLNDFTDVLDYPCAIKISYDEWDNGHEITIDGFDISEAQELIDCYNIKRMWRD